jgi:hypothetical protein
VGNTSYQQGSTGFGIRNNNGVLEFKNNSGTNFLTWTALGSGGSGGSGGSENNNSGQLYYNPVNPITSTYNAFSFVGGTEYNIVLDTPMT